MPPNGPPPALPLPEAVVLQRIAAGGRAVVALSGGVDSSLVAALAFEALGARAEAVTLTGPAVSHAELADARGVARAIGLAHTALPADPLDRAAYRANGTDRCYHCRSVEAGALRSWGDARGFAQYLDGIHADDPGDDRPGLRAMDEAGFLHPLLDAGWGKREVREAARRRALPNWDRPSNACLASRVAHGTAIDPELLRRIEVAEAIVTGAGFRRVRVRVGPSGARIEVDPAEVDRLRAEPLASELLHRVRAAGFEAVSIDPRGYRRGETELPVVR
jgi:pyridinium-3,5-biscarboxylic acid mononucleotide sulfurtransferase